MSEAIASPQRFDILLVEDNEDDVLLTRHAFKSTPLVSSIHIAHDGLQGLEFLRREGQYADAPRPDVILLDLNMPRMDGREMLARMKADAKLCGIPVIVLSTSDAESDIANAYKAHANAYMTKPVDYKKFAKDIERFIGFWFGLVKLPGRDGFGTH